MNDLGLEINDLGLDARLVLHDLGLTWDLSKVDLVTLLDSSDESLFTVPRIVTLLSPVLSFLLLVPGHRPQQPILMPGPSGVTVPEPRPILLPPTRSAVPEPRPIILPPTHSATLQPQLCPLGAAPLTLFTWTTKIMTSTRSARRRRLLQQL